MKESGFIRNLKHVFNMQRDFGSPYLFVYWQGWGEQVDFLPVFKGEYAWAAHDSYMAKDQNASILAMALDLKGDFDAQIPDHMRQAETLEAFAYDPTICIPDRSGKVPPKEKITRFPRLRLVVNNP